MKITTLTYQQTFPTGQFMNVKLGMEVSLEESDSQPVEETYKRMKELTEKAFREMYPEPNGWLVSENYPLGVIDTTLPEADRQLSNTIEALSADIMSCNDLKTIDSYRLLVKTKPELEEVFNKRRAELVEMESNAIIAAADSLIKNK